ncbi:MAG: twin-arginine translocation signal domain-containing protein, partial [Chthoniobacterales bacterium]|nr:twin-arginine translocation signal domain-containing protein [Chthoniobacterales bacterium]
MKTERAPISSAMDRRRFLVGTGLTVAGMALTLRSRAQAQTLDAPAAAAPNDLSSWQNVRA